MFYRFKYYDRTYNKSDSLAGFTHNCRNKNAVENRCNQRQPTKKKSQEEICKYFFLAVYKPYRIGYVAGHLFQEQGALEKVAHLAGEWFVDNMGGV